MTVPAVTPDIPSRKWRAVLALLRRLPQAGLSRSLGRLADLPLPERLRRPVLGTFASAVGIDVEEAEHPLEAYPSLNAFFVRRLAPGRRRWPGDPTLVTSPVDGVVGQMGRIESGRIIQAKGRDYAASDLLGDEMEAREVEGGRFVTLYLAPRHYHRIHAPFGGIIVRARHVPGSLLPVNRPAVEHVEDLFARNERLLCHIHGRLGRITVVAVGAYNVGRISAAFDPAWGGEGEDGGVTNRPEDPPSERVYDPPVEVERGDEIMAFHLGSTVILLFPPDAVHLDPDLRPGRELRLGDVLASPL
jgi:phosphatidylserine decarboxylase